MRAQGTLLLLLALRFLTLANSKSLHIDELKKERETSAQRIGSHGYPVETHEVETSDGYILTLFRIPYSPKLQNGQQKERPAILLQHGLFSCSDGYLLNGPNDALAYLLADAGYDVWLGNARGNVYSRKNTKISLKHPYFWRFSWHEIGVIDMATIIDYILEQTGQSALHYAGHSQGTTVFFVLMSMRPEYNEKIKTAHMLAPVAYVGNMTDLLITQLAPVLGVPNLWSKLFGDQEFFPQNSLVQNILNTLCGGDVRYPKYCKNIFLMYTGSGHGNFNMTLLPQVAETHPAGVSTNQMLHYLQEFISNEFRQFDWGSRKNQKLYGQDTPPNYDLRKVTAPVYLYYGGGDDSANPRDVNRLAGKLPNLKLNHRVPLETWGHLDFLFALKVKTYINDLVIETCNEYENNI